MPRQRVNRSLKGNTTWRNAATLAELLLTATVATSCTFGAQLVPTFPGQGQTPATTGSNIVQTITNGRQVCRRGD